MLQNLSSAAVVIGALRVNEYGYKNKKKKALNHHEITRDAHFVRAVYQNNNHMIPYHAIVDL